MKMSFNLIGILPLIGAIICSFKLFFTCSEVHNLRVSGILTRGIVDSSYRVSNTEQDHEVFLIKFLSKNNQIFHTESTALFFDQKIYNINDTTEILYLPQNPEKAKVNSFNDMEGEIVVDALFDAFFIILFILCFKFNRFQNTRQLD